MAAELDTDTRAPRPPLYNDPRIRGILYQVLVLGLVIAGGWYLIDNTLENRARLGVASGFDFLNRLSGFDISQTLIQFSSSTGSYGRAFIVGLLNTFYVAVVGIVIATVVGLIMGIARLSSNWLVNRLALIYIEVVRNVPILLQLIFWYAVVLASLPPRADDAIDIGGFAFLYVRGLHLPKPIFGPGSGIVLLSVVVGIVAVVMMARWARTRQERTGEPFPTFLVSLAILILLPLLAYLIAGRPVSLEIAQAGRFRIEGGWVLLPEFLAITLGLAIYTGSFIAEIVRSGILAVSKGQWEASGALGLSRGQTLRLVIVPQALRVIIPPQTSQYLNLTKNSSLGVAIGYPDFFNIASTINNQTGQAVEVISITMAVYLLLSLLISGFMNWYNAKIALVER
jgi:general L-amino acid transport system permease protein